MRRLYTAACPGSALPEQGCVSGLRPHQAQKLSSLHKESVRLEPLHSRETDKAEKKITTSREEEHKLYGQGEASLLLKLSEIHYQVKARVLSGEITLEQAETIIFE